MAATTRGRLLLHFRRSGWFIPLRRISVFVDSRVIDSYGAEEDEEQKICNALSLGSGNSNALLPPSTQLVLRREEPYAVDGFNVAKEKVTDGTGLRLLTGSKTFRPSRLDNQLVTDLSRLLKQGNVSSWEAEDVVRNYGAILTPYHVCEVLKNFKEHIDMAYTFFKWADMFPGFKHDNYSCNAMIRLLGNNKKYDEIKNVLFGMDDQMIRRTDVTYRMLMGIYVQAGMVEDALEAFHELEQCEVRATVEDYNYFMHSLVMLDQPRLVPIIFDSMQRKKVKADSQTFNIVINSYAKVGQMDEAYKLFRSMRKNQCWPNEYTYAALINGFCKCSSTSITFSLLKEMLDRKLNPNEALYNMMMDAHYRLGKHEKVCQIFELMLERNLEPDSKSYRILIDSYADAGKLEDCYRFFTEMVGAGYIPGIPAYNTVMNKLAKSGNEQAALEIFEGIHSPTSKVQATLVSYNIGMDLLCKAGRLDDAWDIYSKIKSMANLYTYNTLISRFGKAGKLEKCLELLDDMHKSGFRLDEFTYSGLVDAHSISGKTDMALRFLDDMKASGFLPTASTLDILAHSLLKAGNKPMAESIFRELRAGKYVPRKKVNEVRSKTPKLTSG